MKTASVSYLKNSLSACLKEVAAGESLLVTDRNKPVAILQPLHRTEDRSTELSRLAALGLVSPGNRKLAVAAFLKKPRGKSGIGLADAIIQDREGR